MFSMCVAGEFEHILEGLSERLDCGERVIRQGLGFGVCFNSVKYLNCANEMWENRLLEQSRREGAVSPCVVGGLTCIAEEVNEVAV